METRGREADGEAPNFIQRAAEILFRLPFYKTQPRKIGPAILKEKQASPYAVCAFGACRANQSTKYHEENIIEHRVGGSRPHRVRADYY